MRQLLGPGEGHHRWLGGGILPSAPVVCCAGGCGDYAGVYADDASGKPRLYSGPTGKPYGPLLLGLSDCLCVRRAHSRLWARALSFASHAFPTPVRCGSHQAAGLVALTRGPADSHCPCIDVYLAPRCLGKRTPVCRNRSRAGTPPHRFWVGLYMLCTVLLQAASHSKGKEERCLCCLPVLSGLYSLMLMERSITRIGCDL